jgi:hypothetical protein
MHKVNKHKSTAIAGHCDRASILIPTIRGVNNNKLSTPKKEQLMLLQLKI